MPSVIFPIQYGKWLIGYPLECHSKPLPSVYRNPQTQNPKPQTHKLKPQIPNPKTQTQTLFKMYGSDRCTLHPKAQSGRRSLARMRMPFWRSSLNTKPKIPNPRPKTHTLLDNPTPQNPHPVRNTKKMMWFQKMTPKVNPHSLKPPTVQAIARLEALTFLDLIHNF